MRSVLGRLGRKLQHVAHALDDARQRSTSGSPSARRAVSQSHARAQCLGDGHEHVGVAVRDALPGEDLGVEVARGAQTDLAREPALADARFARQQHEMRAVLARRPS